MKEQNVYTRRVVILIVAFTIAKIIAAPLIDLSNDESYYWLYSQHLKWNYFDHPPLVALWIRIFTFNLLLEGQILFLRLGGIIGCALATWFMYKCVSTISTQRAGWFAACCYNASFYAGITAGFYIMPDSPQMVFFTFSLWMIARIIKDEKNRTNWILFGIASGLCIMSKVHGIFIWTGFMIYILLYKKNWLLSSRFYTALIIALIITCPILIWNIHYDFLSYRFHKDRIVSHGFPLNVNTFFKEFLGQISLNNPFNVALIIFSFFSLRKIRWRSPALSVYTFIALPLILLLLFISLHRQTLPHWSGPAYVTLIPLAAVALSEIRKRRLASQIIILSIGSFIIVSISSICVTNFYPGNFGNQSAKELGKGDFTLDVYGWQKAAKIFDTVYKVEIANGIMPANAPMICNKWWGSHIEYYFCRPNNIKMIGLGQMNDLHEYMWLNKNRKEKVNLSSAYCIINSDDYYNVQTYKNYYSKIDTVKIIQVTRGNKPANNFYVFRLSGWKNNKLAFADW